MTQFSGRLGGIANDFSAALLKHDLIRLATDALTGFAKTALDSYADNERLGLSLDTLIAKELRQKDASLSMSEALTQAAPKAQELLKWNTQLAVNSPFTEQGVAAAFRTAEAYGFVSDSADKTAVTAKRLTQDIVDFVAGSGQSEEAANRVALALGQIQAKGRVAGQEVLQLVNAGIPVDQILATAFNKTTAEIVALREKGAIPADAAIKAIVRSLESDFGGAAKRQAGSVSGLISSLEDLQRIGARDLLGPAFQAAQPYVQQLVDTLQDPKHREEMQAFGTAIGTLAGEAIPAVVQAGGEFVRMLETVGTAGEPVFTFIREHGIPIVAGLATAYTINLIPALIASVPAILASAGAFVTANAPIVLVGAAIAGVLKSYQDYEAQIARVADKVLAGNTSYQDGLKALDEYHAAGDTAAEGAKTQAQAVEQLQTEQHALLETYALHLAAYQNLGRASGQSEASLQAERDAINAHTTAIEGASGRLRERVDLYKNLHDTDAIEDIRLQRDAHQQLGAQIGLSSAELQKYQDKLDKVGASGADAAQKLQDAQSAFQQAEQGRLQDHQTRLGQIEEAGNRERGSAHAQNAEQRAALEQTHQTRIAELTQAGARAAADAERGEQERQRQDQQQFDAQREGDLTQHQQRLVEIQGRANDLADQEQQQRADREQQHQDRLTEITRRGATQAAEAEQRALDQREQAQQQYTDRATALTRQLADVQERAAEQAADRAQSLADRISDINTQATDRTHDAQERYAVDTQQKAEDHQDRLTDLQERLGEAATAAQRASIQHQIDQENEKYAKQQERAQAAFERAQQEAQEEVQRQIDRAQQQAARDEAKAQQEKRRQEQHIAEQQALLEQAYQRETARREQQTQQEQASRAAALAQQLADEQQSADRAAAAAQRKYEHETAQLDAATAKEQAAYQAREALAAAHFAQEQTQRTAHFAQEQADRAATLAGQLADEQTTYAQRQAELRHHYVVEGQARNAAIVRRITEETASYADQEATAKESFTRQETDLRAALGKQLAAYVDIQQDMTQITGAEASKRRAIIAAELGFDPQAEQQRFGAILAQITGPAGGGGARSDGSNTTIGSVTIIVPGAGDPAQVAAAVRDELIRTGRRNAGLGGILGGY